MGISATSRIMDTPVGTLRLSARGDVLTHVTWCTEPRDKPQGESPLLRRAIAQLEAYFAGDLRVFDLPLAPAGSPFQQRVWTEMARIPYGRTRTYGDLARRVEGVAQAVGQACGANPIPIIIPCHRVVAGGGRLGGFSGGWGVVSKRALLAHENAVPDGADLFAPSVGEEDSCPR